MSTHTLKSTLQSDLTDAMRSKDATRTATLRMALTAITNTEVAGDEARELSDDEVLKVLAKEAKKRREAAEAYAGAGRPELAERENAELSVLEGYLPSQLSDSDVRSLVAQALEQSGATSMAHMGQVMKVAQQLIAGRADGARVAQLVREQLAAR